MRLIALCLGTLAVGLAAAACSSSSGRTPTTTATVTQPARTVTITAQSVTSAAATRSSTSHVYKIGQTFAGNESRVTVLGFESTSDVGSSGQAGMRLASLHVRVCVEVANSGISAGPWSLVGSDDGSYATTVSGGGIKEPQYPVDGVDTAKGECVSGWITYNVPRAAKIIAAKYNPQRDDSSPAVLARWSLA